jgi:hypothetical protein
LTPASAKTLAQAAPIPLLAPVIKTIWVAKEIIENKEI